ncbi:MAG: cache domain-containing protein, partial [Burkholderiales bacterium]
MVLRTNRFDTRYSARGVAATSAAVFLALSILFSALGYLSYRSQATEVERQYSAELAKEVGLRKTAIEYWLDERWADAQVLKAAPTIGHLRDGDARAPDDRIEALTYLKTLRSNYGYLGISVMTRDGREIASAGETFADAPAIRAVAATIAGTPRRVMLGPRPLKAGGIPLIAFMLPLPAAAPSGDRGSGEILVLYVDPRHALFGILRDQPAGSWEAILVHADGDDVEFLSPRKFDPEGKLPTRLPNHELSLPATREIAGFEEGVDYRGVRVLYSAARIADTDWYVLEKLDRAQALAPLQRDAKVLAAWTLLLIALAGLAAFWFERRRDLADKLFRQKSTLEHAALEEHFRHLTQYVNDATF